MADQVRVVPHGPPQPPGRAVARRIGLPGRCDYVEVAGDSLPLAEAPVPEQGRAGPGPAPRVGCNGLEDGWRMKGLQHPQVVASITKNLAEDLHADMPLAGHESRKAWIVAGPAPA